MPRISTYTKDTTVEKKGRKINSKDLENRKTIIEKINNDTISNFDMNEMYYQSDNEHSDNEELEEKVTEIKSRIHKDNIIIGKDTKVNKEVKKLDNAKSKTFEFKDPNKSLKQKKLIATKKKEKKDTEISIKKRLRSASLNKKQNTIVTFLNKKGV